MLDFWGVYFLDIQHYPVIPCEFGTLELQKKPRSSGDGSGGFFHSHGSFGITWYNWMSRDIHSQIKSDHNTRAPSRRAPLRPRNPHDYYGVNISVLPSCYADAKTHGQGQVDEFQPFQKNGLEHESWQAAGGFNLCENLLYNQIG